MFISSPPNSHDNSGVKIPPPLMYAGVFAAGLLLQHLFPVEVLSRVMGYIPALICISVSAILGIWSIGWFLRLHTSPLLTKPSTALVTTGPYRFTRNPMYISLLFLYVGFALWLDVFWAMLLLPLIIVTVRYSVIAREEQYLERQFGQEYLHYKARVRRWF